MEKLVEYKKQKLDMERTLYAQFVAVLNKKKKILNQIEGYLHFLNC
jgi:DNA double-strand break repair and V(D)J recombination protein XRCC4.